jgi:hypothetical protein
MGAGHHWASPKDNGFCCMSLKMAFAFASFPMRAPSGTVRNLVCEGTVEPLEAGYGD